MSMTIAAYLRVSTGQQSIDQQHDAIATAGITPDRVFTDTASGRAGSNRPGWTECMGYLRAGRSPRGRRRRPARTLRPRGRHRPARADQLVASMSGRCGKVWTPAPRRGAPSRSIMATIAELELELGKERRAASREARVARGLAATKPMKLDAAQQKRLLRLYQQGEPVSELTAMFGISRSTLFRTLKVLKQQEPISA